MYPKCPSDKGFGGGSLMSLPYNNSAPLLKSGGVLTGEVKSNTVGAFPFSLMQKSSDGSTNSYKSIRWYDAETNEDIGGIQYRRKPDGQNAIGLLMRAPNTEKFSTIEIQGNADGTFSTHAPTPPVNSNNTNIATTAFCNGQWIKKTLTIASEGSLSGGGSAKDFSLSSYLPNDGRVYEVMIRTNLENLNGYCLAFYKGQLFEWADIARFKNNYGSNCQILPIGTDRKLTIGTNTSSTGTHRFYIQAVAYRRVR